MIRLLALATFSASATLMALPWYYQIYAWTGSPLYSGENVDHVVSRYFPQLAEPQAARPPAAGGSEQAAISRQQAAGNSQPATQNILRNYFQTAYASLARFSPQLVLFFIWHMSMGEDFQKTLISPLFLAFIPLLLLFRSDRRGVGVVVGYGLGYFLLGLNLWGDYNRYVIPCFPVLAIVVGKTVENIQQRHGRLGQFSKGVCLLMCGLYCPALFHEAIHHFPVAVGLRDRASYSSKLYPGSFRVAQYVNQQLPPTAKLLFIGEYNLHLFDREYLLGSGAADPNSGGDESLVLQYRHFQEPARAYQRLQRLGVTHVILNRRVSNNSGYNDNQQYIVNFRNAYLRLVYDDAEVYLYQLKIEDF